MATNDENDVEEYSHRAAQVIIELLCPIRSEQVRAYLEKTGWKLQANDFNWKDGWTLRPDKVHPASCVYSKPDPESTDGRPFVVEVPGREDQRDYLGCLQLTVERIAAVEETTFVTVICRVLGVEQLVLLPESKQKRR